MTLAPRLSVVVASYGRPAMLRRCLLALAQGAGPGVEAIVVADKAALETVAALPFADRITTVLQAEPNVSRARNDGIARAAGEIVAFLDDDAVPEPTWAQAIRRGFADRPGLSAGTGPVLGRDGISMQCGPVAVDRDGRETRLDTVETGRLPQGVLKLSGTNMAVRKDALLSVGGFDEAMRFHLEDVDLALRLDGAGYRSAWFAGAQVHHARAASDRRSDDLVPLSLFDLGASTAILLRKQAPSAIEAALAGMVEAQRAQLFRLARKRKLGPHDIERLMADLRQGISEGRHRPLGGDGLQTLAGPFHDLDDGTPAIDAVLTGWRFRAGRLRSEAARLTADGARVTLLLFEPTFRAHRVRYSDGGWWEQTGGLFGPSQPDAALVQPWRVSSRVGAELARLKSIRFEENPVVRFIDS